MSLESTRLKTIAALGVGFALLVAATYGLTRRIPFLTRPAPLSRSVTGDLGSTAGLGFGTITGIASRADGSPQPARVTLVRTTDSPRPMTQTRARGGPGRGSGLPSTAAGPDGRFVLHGVPAGTFWLVAHAEIVAEAPSLPTHFWGVRDVTSNGREVADTTVSLEPGGTITGVMEFMTSTGTARPDASTATIVLMPADARTQAQFTAGYPQVRPHGSGAFVLPGIAPGRYTLDLSAFQGWSLDSATLDGQDWIGRPFEVPAGSGTRRAKLVFTDRPNVVTGVVRHASGRPGDFVLIMVFSEDPALRQVSRRVQAARTDAEGRFTLGGLPAGSYLVAAATDLPPERWYTVESFAELAPHAAAVSLGHGDTKTVGVQIR